MDDNKAPEYWMKYAFAEAEKAREHGEAPIGAVIVKDGRIIGRGSNRVETLKDPTAHAEIIAIGAASEETGYERLVDSATTASNDHAREHLDAFAVAFDDADIDVDGVADLELGGVGLHAASGSGL